MFLSNVPAILRMMVDRRVLGFGKEMHEKLGSGDRFRFGPVLKSFKGLVRGERIIRHGGQYIISSFVPPLPSRALMQFLQSGSDIDGEKDVARNMAYARTSAPLSCYLKLTERCNYDCEHCSAKFGDQTEELTTGEWVKVVRDLQELGVSFIGISGGEPLIRNDVEEILSAMDDRSATILFTNGSMLSYERAKALKENGLFCLSVSLDSAGEETHNRIRGDEQAFEKALTAIENARKAGLYTVVQSVVYRDQLSRSNLLRLFKLVKRHGAREVRLHQPAPAGCLLDPEKAKGVLYTDEDREAMFRIQFEVNRKWFGYPKVSSFPYTEGRDKFGCTAGILHSYITAQGELTPCDFIPLSFGNVLDEDLADVYARMRSAMGQPRMRCMSLDIKDQLVGVDLPVRGEEAARIAAHATADSYPRFFQDLQDE